MPTDSGQVTRKAHVHSDGERLWRAKPGATSTFAENVAARELFIDLHHDEFWNPGVSRNKLPNLSVLSR